MYGINSFGGAHNFGTIFSLNVGLGPFVETRPTFGTIKSSVEILGNDLTGATSVAFEGTPAKFTVVSSSEITATVPTGASTGKVAVKTPARTLSSNIVFRTPAFTTLAAFDSSNGSSPNAFLVQGTDGAFYGATFETLFKIRESGQLTTLYTSLQSVGGLVEGYDGNFYGTTGLGGANQNCNDGQGCGTVFKITLEGTLTTLHNFNGNDGNGPGALVQATDGDFYGSTRAGGPSTSSCEIRCGTVFKITPGGTLTTLHFFEATDGQGPVALLQASDGIFMEQLPRAGLTPVVRYLKLPRLAT